MFSKYMSVVNFKNFVKSLKNIIFITRSQIKVRLNKFKQKSQIQFKCNLYNIYLMWKKKTNMIMKCLQKSLEFHSTV